MSPIIKQVSDLLYEKRIDKHTFLVELADHAEKECTEGWLKSGYRWFSSDITPRKQTTQAIKSWLKVNKHRKVMR